MVNILILAFWMFFFIWIKTTFPPSCFPPSPDPVLLRPDNELQLSPSGVSGKVNLQQKLWTSRLRRTTFKHHSLGEKPRKRSSNILFLIHSNSPHLDCDFVLQALTLKSCAAVRRGGVMGVDVRL